MNERYSSLKHEAKDLVYPVFININADSEDDGGASKVNIHNIAVVTEHVIWVIEPGMALSHPIGIVIPYHRQVNVYSGVLTTVAEDRPSIRLKGIQN